MFIHQYIVEEDGLGTCQKRLLDRATKNATSEHAPSEQQMDTVPDHYLVAEMNEQFLEEDIPTGVQRESAVLYYPDCIQILATVKTC